MSKEQGELAKGKTEIRFSFGDTGLHTFSNDCITINGDPTRKALSFSPQYFSTVNTTLCR